MISTEAWRPIPGLRGYEASTEGRIRSWRPWRGTPVPRVVRPILRPDGYHQMKIDGRTRLVHQMVLAAHAGPRPDGQEVRHLDGDPLNNWLANLAYGTPSENSADKVRHGTHPWAAKTHCPQGHPYDAGNTWRSARSRHCKSCVSARAAAPRQRDACGSVVRNNNLARHRRLMHGGAR